MPLGQQIEWTALAEELPMIDTRSINKRGIDSVGPLCGAVLCEPPLATPAKFGQGLPVPRMWPITPADAASVATRNRDPSRNS
jgi:hypothetical protein